MGNLKKNNNIRYYQPFFDIKTIEVRNRILQSFIPIKSNFLDTISKNPDLFHFYQMLFKGYFLGMALFGSIPH